jgi:hypothetical protein
MWHFCEASMALPLVHCSNGIAAILSWHQIKLVGAREKWRCRDADMAPFEVIDV